MARQMLLQECDSCHEQKLIREGNTICGECGAIWFPIDRTEADKQLVSDGAAKVAFVVEGKEENGLFRVVVINPNGYRCGYRVEAADEPEALALAAQHWSSGNPSVVAGQVVEYGPALAD